MGGINFAPGEQGAVEDDFSPSVVMFWVKTHIGVSNTRLLISAQNTIFGIIPLGSNENTFPLANVAGVGTNTKFSVFRAIWGIVFLIIGLSMISSGGGVAVFGVIFLLIAISLLANSMTARLTVTNNGGAVLPVRVSILEKAKLEQMREAINQRLLADHGRLRHEEHMFVQNQQLSTQQQQLNAQIMQQQNYLADQQRQQYGSGYVQQPGQYGRQPSGQNGQPGYGYQQGQYGSQPSGQDGQPGYGYQQGQYGSQPSGQDGQPDYRQQQSPHGYPPEDSPRVEPQNPPQDEQ